MNHIKIYAALLAVLMLSGCAGSEPVPTDTSPSVSSVLTETEASVTVTSAAIQTSASTAATTQTAASHTSISVSETETATETTPADITTAPVTSEIITESVRTELLASESAVISEITAASSETLSISETTTPLSEKITTAATPAVVEVPDVNTGDFDGSNVLENEYACVDCSDTKNGVILVKYSGSCEKLKVRITKGSAIYDYNLEKSGSVFPLQSGSGTYNIKVLENVSGKTYAIVLDMDFDAQLSDSFRPYLMPSQYIDYSGDDDCVYRAAQLCAGKKGDTEKISSMFSYITDNISYDKKLAANVKSGYIPDPDVTLEKGTGICFDYASLFAAMCRSQNIPAKLVMGYVRGDVYHAWNEVYTKDTGWVTVDLFLDEKGWNLLDPTFYASADNKEEVAEYIGGGSDYSAVYFY